MGAGKTTIGRQLAEMLKLPFFDADVEVVSRAGAPIDWIWDIEGEEGFRQREWRAIGELTQKQGIVLATGGGAVINPQNRTNLAARGVVIYLETSVEQQLQRTRKDKQRPLIQTENPKQRLQSLMEGRRQFYEEIADICVKTDGHSVKTVANTIYRLISEKS